MAWPLQCCQRAFATVGVSKLTDTGSPDGHRFPEPRPRRSGRGRRKPRHQLPQTPTGSAKWIFQPVCHGSGRFARSSPQPQTGYPGQLPWRVPDLFRVSGALTTLVFRGFAVSRFRGFGVRDVVRGLFSLIPACPARDGRRACGPDARLLPVMPVPGGPALQAGERSGWAVYYLLWW
jgi:hypothetical protein